MRAKPVAFAQNNMKRDQCVAPGFASLTRATDEGVVQHSAMNTTATIDAATNSTAAPGIAARKSVIDHAPASQAIDHVATRAKSLALRGSAATGGSAWGNEITSANSTQLNITSG